MAPGANVFEVRWCKRTKVVGKDLAATTYKYSRPHLPIMPAHQTPHRPFPACCHQLCLKRPFSAQRGHHSLVLGEVSGPNGWHLMCKGNVCKALGADMVDYASIVSEDYEVREGEKMIRRQCDRAVKVGPGRKCCTRHAS
jgi:hypothetical protein